MAIMNIVWPVAALFGTVLTAAGCFRYGRLSTQAAVEQAKAQKKAPPAEAGTPYGAIVGKGALHCGAGCALGDIVAEWLAFVAPAVADAFGWHGFFDDKMHSVWVLDFLLAFSFGVVFQYCASAPMRGLEPGWKAAWPCRG